MEYKGESLKTLENFIFVKEMNEGEKFKDLLTIDNKNGKIFTTKKVPSNISDLNYLNTNYKLIKKNKDKIAYYYDIKKTKHNYYFVVEYFNGGNLKNFQKNYKTAKNSQLTEKFIRNCIYQIITQLKILYQNKGLYHFVRPENILINLDMYENRIVNGNLPPKIDYSKIIIDNEPFTLKFGNYFHFQNIEGTENIEVGNYMSPEMAIKYKSGENKIIIMDAKNDIWSIGVLTYELLTGKKIFEGNTPEGTYNNIINGKYSFPSGLKASYEIISFIIELLQYSPEKRLDLEQIKDLPFLKKEVEDYNFIEIKGKDVEVDSRDPKSGLTILKKAIFGEEEDDEAKMREKELNIIKKEILGLNEENLKAITDFEKDLKALKNLLNISNLKK